MTRYQCRQEGVEARYEIAELSSILLLIASCLLISCGGPGLAPLAGDTCRRTERIATLDSVDGSGAFYRIEGILADLDGGLFVLDGGESRLYALDRDGSLRWSVGGEGAGLGEFLYANGLSMIGDTLAVYDLGNHRLSFWSRAGDHLGVRSLSSLGLPGHPAWLEPIASNRIVATIFPVYMASSTPVQLEGTVVIASSDSPPDTLISFTHTSGERIVRDGRVIGEVPRPYRGGLQYPPLSGGGFVLVRGEEYLLTVFGVDGKVLNQIRGPEFRPDLEAWHRRAYLDQLQDTMLASRVEFPTVLPSINRVTTTADGAILVGTYWWTEDGYMRWDRWDADGRYVYSFIAPRDLQLLAGAGDWLYGRLTDSLGVHSIGIYRITGTTQCPGPPGVHFGSSRGTGPS